MNQKNNRNKINLILLNQMINFRNQNNKQKINNKLLRINKMKLNSIKMTFKIRKFRY